MEWLNEPTTWSLVGGDIVAHADPQTDSWRITRYGYVRDNAHIYGEAMPSDFDLKVRLRAEYAEQYDQAGVTLRTDERHWLKTGVELLDG